MDVNGTLFFTRDSDGNYYGDIWKSDGTVAGTQSVASNVLSPLINPQLTNCDGALYFAGLDGVYDNTAMWRSDGTTNGTHRIVTLNLSGDDRPKNFTVFAGRVYFTATVGGLGEELWSTDGTAIGTSLAANVNQQGSTSPTNLTVVNGRLFFSGFHPDTGRELYSFDGTTASLVADLNPGLESFDPKFLTASGNTLYFTGDDGTHGREVWKIAGPPAVSRLTLVGPSTLPELSETQFTARALLTDGTTINITPQWSITSSFASVSAGGLVKTGEVFGTQVCVLTATTPSGSTEVTTSRMLRLTDGTSSTTVSRPVIKPTSAPFVFLLPITITCSTRGATIHYTLDGSEPTPDSPAYTGPLSIVTTGQVHARAFKPGFKQSSVARAFYVKATDDDALSSARDFGTLSGDRISIQDGVGWNDGEDYFYFDLPAPDQVQISLSHMSADANLDLIDSSGDLLVQKKSTGKQAEVIVTSLPAGRYFLRPHITGPLAITAADSTPPTSKSQRTVYTLTVSNGPEWKVLKIVDVAHHVGLLPQGGDGTKKWIVVHGRQAVDDSSIQSGVERFDSLIAQLRNAEPDAQVLALDWATAAESQVLGGAKWIPFIAKDLAGRLKGSGIRGSNLNMVGHSWGSYVAVETLRALGGADAAQRIIALDPALLGTVFGDFTGYSPSNARFALNSTFSWAFYTSAFGSDKAAATADESFIVNWEDGFSVTGKHSGAIEVLLALLAGNDADTEALFHLDRMQSGSAPWLPNQFAAPFGASRVGPRGRVGDALYPFDAVLKFGTSPVRLRELKYSDR